MLNKSKIARIHWFFMVAKHEDFHRYILENAVVDNFLMQFWTLAQQFGSNIFYTRRCAFSRSTTYQKFTLGSVKKVQKQWLIRQKSRILPTQKLTIFQHVPYKIFFWAIWWDVKKVRFYRADCALSFGVWWSYLQSSSYNKTLHGKKIWKIFTLDPREKVSSHQMMAKVWSGELKICISG